MRSSPRHTSARKVPFELQGRRPLTASSPRRGPPPQPRAREPPGPPPPPPVQARRVVPERALPPKGLVDGGYALPAQAPLGQEGAVRAPGKAALDGQPPPPQHL